jgi:outer membrane protein assembly factor BamB
MNRHLRSTALVLFAAAFLAGCAGVAGSSLNKMGNWLGLGPKQAKIAGERISIVSADAELAVDPALASVPVQMPAPVANSEWPEPGHAPTNAIPNAAGDAALRPVWNASAGKGSDDDSRATASPIVADGMVFALDAEATVFAFNAGNGQVIWSKDLTPPESATRGSWMGLVGGGTDGTKGFGGGLAYSGGKLFVASGFGQVRVLDPKTGADVWKVDIGVPVHSAPVVDNGRVYIITQENELRALDEKDGKELWRHNGIAESASVLLSSNVAVSGEFVIVPYSSGEIYALRADNGTMSWSDSLSRTGNVTALTALNDIAGRPVIDRDMVFAVSHAGRLAAINIRTGERIWARNLSGIQTPVVVGDFVFLVTTEGQVMCLARVDGRVKWIQQLEAYLDPEDKEDPIVWTGPLLVNNKLVLVSSTGRGVTIDPQTGAKLSDTELPEGTLVPMVVAQGTMFMLSEDGNLIAMR